MGGECRTAYVTPGLRLTRQPADRKERRVRYCHTVADCIVVTATIVLCVLFSLWLQQRYYCLCFYCYGYNNGSTICPFVAIVTANHSTVCAFICHGYSNNIIVCAFVAVVGARTLLSVLLISW